MCVCVCAVKKEENVPSRLLLTVKITHVPRVFFHGQ